MKSPIVLHAAPVLLIAALAGWNRLSPAGELPVDSDVKKANSYDNDWEAGWVAHLREIHARAKDKTDGFVIHIGDSISYANQYGIFARSYKGDNEIGKTLQWTKCGFGDNYSNTPPDCKNGWSLTAYDHPAGGRSYTAQSGITAAQWLRGGKNMAAGRNDKHPLDTLLDNTTTGPHPDSKEGYKVAVVQDAMMAVVMLGTNDLSAGRPASKIRADLATIIDKLQKKDIMPIISTVPPYPGKEKAAEELNGEIRSLAREKKIPLIDFYAEIVRRRPNGTWNGTLMHKDNVHPSPGRYQDPFKNPEVLSNIGFLLRGFLSVCKIHEVKKYVLDGQNPPGGVSAVSGSGGDLTITTAVLPPATKDAVYNVNLEAEGGTPPYRWTAFSRPSGMKLSRDGVLSGKPKRSGKFSIKFKVNDKKGKTARKTIELTVK